MAFEHDSGLQNAYDRSQTMPNAARMVVPEGSYVQGANLNEIQSIEARRNRRGHNMTAKDGDRVEGGEVIIDVAAEQAILAAGRVYIEGDVRPVAASVIDVPVTGEITIGVKLQRNLITHVEDPNLLGLAPGTVAEGEPGASRVDESIVWALSDDDQAGEYFPVYTVRDGVVTDQAPPPILSGVAQQIARYDFAANANYIVSGCNVVALGKTSGKQVFSIGSGEANIVGFKRIREAAIRHEETEAPDLESVAAEPHTFTGPTGGTTVINVSRAPIGTVSAAIVTKRVTEVVTRGVITGGIDLLQYPSAVEIETVVQGGTTYVAGTDYTLSGGGVSWAPGGAEPAANSTYSVTYLYNAEVTPDDVTDTTVTVSGGVNGKPVLISYTSKIPRIDILCLDITGLPVYVKGISARANGLAPQAPSTLLKLAEIYNNWITTPTVVNNGTSNYTYDEQRRLFDRLITVLEQFDRGEMERDIIAREPVSKNGIFTDALVDDFYRDQGASQTMAINRGVGQLAIDNVLMQRAGTAIETLPYEEEIVLRQDLRTSGYVINSYDNYDPFPASLRLTPTVDFWEEEVTNWTSPITREFAAAPNEPPGQTTINEVTEIRKTNATFLRTITIQAKLEGFGVGENLSVLTFDGVNVKPPGTQTADSNGEITVSFAIPANTPAGRRLVRAEGAAGSFAEAIFVGEGTVDVFTMRRVTLVTRAAPLPPPPQPPVIVNIINNIVTTGSGGVSEGSQGGGDPLAQTFTLPEDRMISGINFWFTDIGNPNNGVRVQLATTQNGFPTREVLAEAFISMQDVEVGELVEARFDTPVFLSATREYCFVILTADGEHAVAIARLGDVDQATQTRVSSQPYTVGVMFSSANRITWTPHQDADIAFQIVAAKFTETSRTVTLWTGAFTNISDVLVRGAVEIPTNEATFRYELVRASGSVIPLAPGQNREFPEFLNETVTVRAVLGGGEKVAATLYPGTLIVGGQIRTSGTYITRLFPMGTAVKIAAIFKAFLPAGSNVTVDVDAGNNVWASLTAGTSVAIGNGWTERSFARDPYTAANGRVRITLTGGPGARASISRIRAYSI